jgi:hypothetical protein
LLFVFFYFFISLKNLLLVFWSSWLSHANV